jgi:hypothetical protein
MLQMGMSTVKQSAAANDVEDITDREARILRSRLRELASQTEVERLLVGDFADKAADIGNIGGAGTLRAQDVITAVESTAAAGLPGESRQMSMEASVEAMKRGELRVHYGRFEQKLVVRPRPWRRHSAARRGKGG